MKMKSLLAGIIMLVLVAEVNAQVLQIGVGSKQYSQVLIEGVAKVETSVYGGKHFAVSEISSPLENITIKLDPIAGHADWGLVTFRATANRWTPVQLAASGGAGWATVRGVTTCALKNGMPRVFWVGPGETIEVVFADLVIPVGAGASKQRGVGGDYFAAVTEFLSFGKTDLRVELWGGSFYDLYVSHDWAYYRYEFVIAGYQVYFAESQ